MSFQGFAKTSLKSVDTGKNGPKIKIAGHVFSDNFNEQLINAVGSLIQGYRDSKPQTTMSDESIAKVLFAYTNKAGKISYGISVELDDAQNILGVPVKFGRGLWVSLPLA
jgi:hypothetical protein